MKAQSAGGVIAIVALAVPGYGRRYLVHMGGSIINFTKATLTPSPAACGTAKLDDPIWRHGNWKAGAGFS